MVKMSDLMGKRFVGGGRDLVTGMDCWGLVMEVYKRYGVDLPDFVVDAFAFKKIDELTGVEASKREWEEVLDPRERDVPLVVLMKMHPQFVTHAGVYVKGNKVIHTTKATGVITSRASALRRVIAGYYRYVPSN